MKSFPYTSGFLFFLLGCFATVSEAATFTCDATTTASCQSIINYVSTNASTYHNISSLFQVSVSSILGANNLPTTTPSTTTVSAGYIVKIPVPCWCTNGTGRSDSIPIYTVQSGDWLYNIARYKFDLFVNYTEIADANNIPDPSKIETGQKLWIPLPCSCDPVEGNKVVHLAYKVESGDTADGIAAQFGTTESTLLKLNGISDPKPLKEEQILDVPLQDPSGSYRAVKWNLSGGAIAGTVIGAIAILLSIGLVSYCLVDKRRKAKKASLLMSGESPLPLVSRLTVVKSVEFSYEELSKATNDFSMANKIGQGGFGSVYYAVLRGEKAAIKKMETQDSNLFLAELNVLTHVHHSNLVRLIGYCIEGALFLVYEYIENGDLSQHLRSGRRSPLSWANRVQIALDSARGLEYIHEHTVPVYIHRDIKSANILIDEKGRAKVADFGLARLTKVGSKSFLTGPVGTIGYMSPEYGQYGRVSPKVDVYAFGVVLYELISAKGAIVTIEPSSNASSEANAKGLVGLFDDALMDEDPKESLQKLVDPRLGNDYPIESLMKMTQLAKACTQYEPHKRPGMISVVVTLMAVTDLISG